jgi:putative ABC transport system permease protein
MSLRHSVSYACRSLIRAPLFSGSVIATLAIGIGSAAAIFAVVDAVILRPLPYGHPEQLVGAWFDMPPMSMKHVEQTPGTYLTFARFAHTISGIAAYQSGSASVGDPDGRAEPARITAAWATASLFPVLEVPALLGRPFSVAEDAPKAARVVVISEGLWKSRFGGDPGVIGRKLLISGIATQIVGVMPARFRFPTANTELWFPLQLDPNDPYPGGFSYDAVARLKPGVSVDAAERDFKSVLPRAVDVAPNLAPGVTTAMVLKQAQPVPRLIPLRDDIVGNAAQTLWIVAATAVLLLLVTCTNVANLLLVRADGRHRELSVRAALGAGHVRVLAHFFTEAALLATVAAAIGLASAWIAIHLLVSRGPAQIPRLAEVHVGGGVAGFTVVVALLVAMACSIIPAVRFVRGGPLSGLRDGGRGGTIGKPRQRARSVLVAAQMALALVVLATSGLLLRSFQRLNAVRPGFDADGVATLELSIPRQRYANDSAVVRFCEQLVRRVAELPGVTAAGLTSRVPLGNDGMNSDPLYAEGDGSTRGRIPPLSLYVTVDSGYFSTMHIPVIAGRNFDALDRQHPDEAILSQAAAALYFHDATGRSVIDKRFQELPTGRWHRVIGVVGSVRDTSLSAEAVRSVYFPEATGGDSLNGQLRRTLAIVARTRGDVATTTRAIQRVIHEMDPTLPTYAVRSMRAMMDDSIARLTFTMIILSVAAAVTLVLGVVGLYGVIAYVVTLRRRELGVRIALGAPPSAVAAMVTRQGLALCVGGIAAGLVLVAILSRFLRSLLFEIGPSDPVTLGAATAVLVTFAALASWAPARRAARVNPIEAMRAD